MINITKYVWLNLLLQTDISQYSNCRKQMNRVAADKQLPAEQPAVAAKEQLARLQQLVLQPAGLSRPVFLLSPVKGIH